MKRLTPVAVLAIPVVAFTIAVSAIGFWKYAHYRYQGLDLAIYTNVLYSLSHGNGWYSSVQSGPYLGDHVEPILLAFAPLFRVWPDARLLIMLQALALGLTAFPIFLLLRGRIRERWAMTLVALWLLIPLLWNAALFEFHALAFAPLSILSAAVAYVRRRLGWFLFWILLALSVREDIALIVAMFGVTAVCDWWSERVTLRARTSTSARRPIVIWVLAPLLLGLVWFVLAMRIAANNSASGSYKFLIYYGWLRDAFSHPLALLQHLASIGNLDMVLGLLLPFLFLPIVRPRWLLLAVPPFLQILLAAPGGSNVVVETHYALLFLPALVLAGIAAIASWHETPALTWRRWLVHRFPLPRPFAIGLGIASFLAAAWALGPFPGIARIVVHGASMEDRARRVAYDAFLARVPPDAAVATSYAALPHVAARASVYSLAYLSLGVTQYGLKPYMPPAPPQYLIIDQRDALAYAVQFPSAGWSAPYAADGPTRLREIIAEGRFAVVAERNGVALLERDAAGIPLSNQYVEVAAPPNARLTVDDLRDVTVAQETRYDQ